MTGNIGRYEVLGTVGTGAMGMVYQARDPVMDRIVAIKVISPHLLEREDLRRRFYQEARTAGNLRHPNIVIVYDCSEHEGTPYLVMEFLEGVDLKEAIDRKLDWTLAKKLDIIHQVCRGLQHAHEKQVIHRDIKPANIHVLSDNTAKILDFGIARLASSTQTQTGHLLGTVGYMSPEQCRSSQVGPSTDIWSVGVLLYEILTFRRPFEGDNAASTIHKIMTQAPPSLSESLDEDFPKELDEIVNQALAKEPEGRFSSVGDFAEALEDLIARRFDLRRTLHGEPHEYPGEQPVRSEIGDTARVALTQRAAALIEAGEVEAAEAVVRNLEELNLDDGIVRRLREELGELKREERPELLESPLLRQRTSTVDPGEKEGVSEKTVTEAKEGTSGRVPVEDFADSRVAAEPSPETPPVQEPAGVESTVPSDTRSESQEANSVSSGETEATELFRDPEPTATPIEETPVPPLRPASTRVGRKTTWIAGAAVVLVVALSIAAGAAYLVVSRWDDLLSWIPGGVGTPAVEQVSLDVSPWAEIVEVRNLETGEELSHLAGRATPVQLELPSGEYGFTVRNPALGSDFRFEATVRADGPQSISQQFPQFDLEQALKEFGLE